MHGRKKVKMTPELIRLQEEKIKKYCQLKEQLFVLKQQKEKHTMKILVVLGKLLQISPEFSTLWNFRREILLSQGEKDPSLVKPGSAALEAELKLTVLILRNRDIKSYGTWYHRYWIISRYFKDDEAALKKELDNTHMILEKDVRNFHCWNYRKLILEMLPNTYQDSEKEFLTKLFSKNPSNYSAWHNKSLLLKTKEEFVEEFDLCKNLFYTDPEDSSSWIFHRFLVERLPDLTKSEYCYELLEILDEEEKKWPILTVNMNMEQKFHKEIIDPKNKLDFIGNKEKEIMQNYDLLIKIDPERTNYYLDKKSDFRIWFHMSKIPNLQELDVFTLNDSQITRFESVVCPSLKHIKILDLSNNMIRKLPSTIRGLENLEELNLNKNQVKYIYYLDGLKCLRILRLEENRIEDDFNDQVLLSESLEEIYLEGNQVDLTHHNFNINFPNLKVCKV